MIFSKSTGKQWWIIFKKVLTAQSFLSPCHGHAIYKVNGGVGTERIFQEIFDNSVMFLSTSPGHDIFKVKGSREVEFSKNFFATQSFLPSWPGHDISKSRGGEKWRNFKKLFNSVIYPLSWTKKSNKNIAIPRRITRWNDPNNKCFHHHFSIFLLCEQGSPAFSRKPGSLGPLRRYWAA